MTTRTARTCRVLAVGTATWLALSANASPALKLHVPSPDWRDQVIYFVMTDRFADGNPRNNDQGAGEFDPRLAGKYSGGDLAGLRARLDYIRGLGATAVWITPPVANQWADPLAQYTGYHGYWAEHFMRVDKHLGSLDGYKRLSHELHVRGMYLVQDIVVNHTGNFFKYGASWDHRDPTRGYTANTGSRPVPRPRQSPFKLNDPRDPAQRRAGIYHWTPDVSDYKDTNQELNFQMSGLDDLNTENPAVRRALRQSYGFWVREVGVDAFRVDTAFYVPADYFADFMNSRDARAPGMNEVARRTGRKQFHVFGEGFGIDPPFADEQARKIERYMTGDQGQPLLPGMLNFALYGGLTDVFARGRPTAELGHRISAMMGLHARPHLMPTFIDNHDVDRFLAGGSMAGLRQALLALMTLPGIPVIYYGTEQGFTQQRASMFAAGWGSGGRDHFDTAAPLYRSIAQMSALRREHRLFSRGTPTVLKDNAAAPGALAWRMAHEGRSALVVMNTADSDTLLDNLDTGLPAGTRLKTLFSLDDRVADAHVGAGGRLSLRLPGRSGVVWQAAPAPATATARASAVQFSLDTLPTGGISEDFTVSGRVSASGPLDLVVDGELSRSVRVLPDADGRWQAVVDTSRMVDPGVRHHVTAWLEGAQQAAPAQGFVVQRAWSVQADISDPAGDDHGRSGHITYPTDLSFATRQMDLRRTKVSTSGGALRLDLSMAHISTLWSPPQGFDHVVFTVYIELPGQGGGATVMPLQNGDLPAGMRWHRRLRVHGWSNALFSSEGASATKEGTVVAPAAVVSTDAASRTVRLVLLPAALGGLKSLAGAKVYVTTWDYDGGYRALRPAAQPYGMGGGDDHTPKVMDDSVVIVLP